MLTAWRTVVVLVALKLQPHISSMLVSDLIHNGT